MIGRVRRRGVTFAFVLVLVPASIAMPSVQAQDVTTLRSFDSADGAYPVAGLVQATNGKLYGTAYSGGANGYGTIFSISTSGKLTVLYSFCAEAGCADGEYPQVPLVQAIGGSFYGTTLQGGANGNGTVFKITAGGRLTTLYSFCAQPNCADGAAPQAGLVQATDGNFYGTTSGGGAGDAGTVFKITSRGKLTTVYSFCAQPLCADGRAPQAALVQATDGNFYGTTYGFRFIHGTVFKVTPAGVLTTLYSFCGQPNCADGRFPEGDLIQALDGNFYGTTVNGGVDGHGTVFQITPAGVLTTLHSFCSQSDCVDGEYPVAGLVQATDGNFYGTTSGGGGTDSACQPFGRCGTVFQISPTGFLRTLYSFCSQSDCADGEFPNSGLVQATNGMFYGTAPFGGTSDSCAYGCGTVFNLDVGLFPFVETQPTSGKVGAAVKVLGTYLTGATGVRFNGTAAVFKVISSSEIVAFVPKSATSGNVEVITPRGTLTSNVPFQVTP
jgi:uncharacterized repeat protein (TIGR03803 family)